MLSSARRGDGGGGGVAGAQKACYGVGHVLNDLCASMWFSYLLVFFHKVLHFSNSLSGYVMLVGQVADAICTPFIGYESDLTHGCCGYGKRKSWHLLGCVCVLLSFPFIFAPCPGCEHAEDWAKFIYYAPFVVIFQFGWAATQISHLSLIPELTPNESERVGLNAIVYALTVTSSVFVYGVAWGLLGGKDGGNVGPEDSALFTTLSAIVIASGSVFVVIFHVGTKETRQAYGQSDKSEVTSSTDSGAESAETGTVDAKEGHVSTETTPVMSESESGRSSTSGTLTKELDSGGVSGKNAVGSVHVTVTDWLQEPQFYQVAMVYMCTRLVVNLSQVYMPMYLTDSLWMSKDYIAIVPLIVFISGFLTSLVMKRVNRRIGRKPTYLVGSGLVVLASGWLLLLRAGGSAAGVLGAAALLGAGNSTILVTAMSILADLIGTNTSSGAFVYGAMSFTDKLFNGVAVVLIQNSQPCPETLVCCLDHVWFYRHLMAFAPAVCAAAGALAVLSLVPVTIGDLAMFRKGQHHRSGLLSYLEIAEHEIKYSYQAVG